MTLLWRATRKAPLRAYPPQTRRSIADHRPFISGDNVLLRFKTDRSASPYLTPPLQPGLRLDTHKGQIRHEDIISKRVRDVIRTATSRNGKQGVEYRLHGVKLEEYVRLTKRKVTPLYPQDAQLIVGLLDLHPEPPIWKGEREVQVKEPKLEILEAGTGHGALTLYLSRAIHAANLPFPASHDAELEGEQDHIALKEWKATRRATIHTIELSSKYSAHAQSIVKNFRHGQYYHNVDFHVGNVSQWTLTSLEARNNQPFLSHAFLDLPGTETHLSAVAAALRTDGTLIVFCPSITQIMACLATVKEGDGLPLEMEKVIELGVNGGTGGREWDVRAVKPRASLKAAAAESVGKADPHGSADEESSDGGELSRDSETEATVDVPAKSAEKADDGWKMVCRPKVGDAIVGGGFVAVFRKQRDMRGGAAAVVE